MKDVVTLRDLQSYFIQSLVDTELKWADAVEQATDKINALELKELAVKSADLSRNHLRILEGMLETLKSKKELTQGIAIKGFLNELDELLKAAADPEVRDAGFIVIHQCMNHYKIAQYGALTSYATLLGDEKMASVLHHILEEEKGADEALTKLAESKINPLAKSPLLS